MNLLAFLFHPLVFGVIIAAMVVIGIAAISLISGEKKKHDEEKESLRDRVRALEIELDDLKQSQEAVGAPKPSAAENPELTNKIFELEVKLKETEKLNETVSRLKAELKSKEGLEAKVKEALVLKDTVTKLEYELKGKADLESRVKDYEGLRLKAAGLEAELRSKANTEKELQVAMQELAASNKEVAVCKEMYEELRGKFESLCDKLKKYESAPDAQALQQGEKAPAADTAGSQDIKKQRVVSPETSSKILEALKELRQMGPTKKGEADKKES